MLSFLTKSVYTLSGVLISVALVTLIFNTILAGQYAEILALIKPSFNAVIPYVMDYNTALLVTEAILLMLSIRFLYFIYNLIN